MISAVELVIHLPIFVAGFGCGFDEYLDHVAEARKIFLCGVLGVGTTGLFRMIELGFWCSLQTAEAKCIGAAIGLTPANWMKYDLSTRYVFRPNIQ
jgi:hypothetical protein